MKGRSPAGRFVTGGPRLDVTAAARHFMDVGGEFEALPEIRQGDITQQCARFKIGTFTLCIFARINNK